MPLLAILNSFCTFGPPLLALCNLVEPARRDESRVADGLEGERCSSAAGAWPQS